MLRSCLFHFTPVQPKKGPIRPNGRRSNVACVSCSIRLRIKGALVLAALACLNPATPQQQTSPEFRVRVSVNLVQVDATVTDSHGKPVPGLMREDFEILLDGKPEEVKSCSFVQVDRSQPGLSSALPAAAGKKPAAALPSMPVAPLKREDVRRTVVLFVDDLSMSSESVPAVRNGLRKFIEKQIQPGDLVAIVRASAGLGALQDFTTDRGLLLAATDQVRWTPLGRGGAQAYRPMGMNPTEGDGEGAALSMGNGQLSTPLGQEETQSRIRNYTIAVASSLRRLLHGMAGLPGRKSVVILSDSLPLATPDEVDPLSGSAAIGSGMGGPILASMRHLVDESVRAGVVLYAIDTRGLNTLRAQAADRPLPAGSPERAIPGTGHPGGSTSDPGGNTDWVWEKMQLRRDEYSAGQWGAMFLASETGGFMITEANFIDAGIERVMNDQSGYYLLGFTPPRAALDPGRDGKLIYHHLKVKVRGAGLHVRSHQGFFGVADEDLAAASSRPELQLAAALESPFQSSGVGLEIQSGFLNARKSDSFIRTAVVLDGHDLAFSGPALHRTGVIHLLVRAFGVSGNRLEGGIDQTLRIDLNDEGYERAMKYGLIYNALLPVTKPGPYQIRAACRDEISGKIGTAGDFVVVPQLKGLALSGIIFQRSLGVEDHVRPAAGPSGYAPGERAEFAFQIINARGGHLTMRTRLFREGVQVSESVMKPIEEGASRTNGRMFTHSSIEIPRNLTPGEYLMRLEVEDTRPAAGHAKAWQWVRLNIRAATGDRASQE